MASAEKESQKPKISKTHSRTGVLADPLHKAASPLPRATFPYRNIWGWSGLLNDATVQIMIDQGISKFLGQGRDDLHDYMNVYGFSTLHPEIQKAIVAKLQMEMR
jgi:hypothetical protein